jgi:hypothetical protein
MAGHTLDVALHSLIQKRIHDRLRRNSLLLALMLAPYCFR